MRPAHFRPGHHLDAAFGLAPGPAPASAARGMPPLSRPCGRDHKATAAA